MYSYNIRNIGMAGLIQRSSIYIRIGTRAPTAVPVKNDAVTTNERERRIVLVGGGTIFLLLAET